MRAIAYSLLTAGILAATAAGQTNTNTTSAGVDINGRPIPTGITSVYGPAGAKSETIESYNGTRVPREKISEQVVSDNGQTRVTERTIQRYDNEGHPFPPEKVRTEEKKLSDGSKTIDTQVFYGDISGNTSLTEHDVTTVRKSGNTTHEDTVVQKPTLNGSLDTVERKEVVKTEDTGHVQETASTYHKDSNGNFPEVRKEVVDQKSDSSGKTVENRAEYEAITTGSMKLANQVITHTDKQADGSLTSVVDIYSTTIPGRAQDANPTPQLRQQQTVKQQVGPGGSLVETIQARDVADTATPGSLGAPHTIYERKCTGSCLPPADKK